MASAYRTEKRKYQRYRVNLSVVYHILGPEHVHLLLEGRTYEAKTLDISHGGVSLSANHYLPDKTEIFLKFIIFESDHTGTASFYEIFDTKAFIKNSIPLEDGSFRLGVEFSKVSQEIRKKINDILSSPLDFSA